MSAVLAPVTLGDFVRKERKQDRIVSFEWRLGPVGDTTDAIATLTVAHHKAGPNYWHGTRETEDYFSVTLRQVKEERTEYGTVRSFMLFDGLGLMKIPAGDRYAAKKLEEAAQTAYLRLQELVAVGDERVLAFFQI